jgi:bacillithiol system protein YtxJ
MDWKKLTSEQTFSEILRDTSNHDVSYLIFKHSTSCSISAMALSRLERSWIASEVPQLVPYYLDLLSYRSISNKVAQDLDVIHQSPQVLVIRNGIAIFNASHMDINFNDIKNALKK